MTSFLKLAAVEKIKGQQSSFYNKDTGKPNPVYQALDQEISKFIGYMKKRSSENYKKQEDESHSRPFNALFELWNKFEPRLPKMYYQKKLLELGDFLVTIKEYKLALWQCYERYLQYFGDINVQEITDVEAFKKVFFPDGLTAENVGLTFRALMGKSISMYQIVKMSDPRLQNKQSVDRCVQILSFLRLLMQVILPKESLCWLVYNGTLHIYNISRHLMLLGHSAKVLEFLLWASVCMETSVPLMGVKYIVWRSTLYTAVCQCYYDCKAGQHAESFARRGLLKITELNKLEGISSNPESIEADTAFRFATVKMAIMVYKRSVMESRRKPKGLLRPKTRANLKDAMNQPWPRTPTEKLLSEMFEGSAAQFLAIIESIQDSNRRIVVTSPPASDNEPEILDVYCELFLAAQEILAGGGGLKGAGASGKPMSILGGHPLANIVFDRNLMELATLGYDGVTLNVVVKLVKWAYNYEQWDTFDSLVDPLIQVLKRERNEQYCWDIKSLELLLALERLNVSNKRFKRTVNLQDDEKEEGANMDLHYSSVPGTVSCMTTNVSHDDLINLAGVLMSIVTGPYSKEKIEMDMVVDAGLFLWNKCKSVFQKYQTGSVDNFRYLSKMENPNKWIHLLDAVHQVLCWCGISSVDPGLTAEVVIRLALVYESSSQLEGVDVSLEPCCFARRLYLLSGIKDSKASLTDIGMNNDMDQLSKESYTARKQLLQAREILELGLQNVSSARQAVALNDIKSVADVSWVKDINPEVFQPEVLKESTADLTESGTNKAEFIPPSMKGTATAVWNTVKDLHLELILMHHRVCLKLAALGPDPTSKNPQPTKRQRCSTLAYERKTIDAYVETFDELFNSCNKNNLSKALLYMQKALLGDIKGAPKKSPKELLEEAVTFIKKTQASEKRLYLDNLALAEQAPRKSKVPPPPILLSRRDKSMVFKPAPFIPAGGEKVAWYRLFGRSASGSNVRVRIGDYFLQGTGEEIPAFDCELSVSGLVPNERYVFAVGAYTLDGKLIGEGIGETSRPILASHPLPILMTWALLSQIAYQTGCLEIAKEACGVLWNHFIADVQLPQHDTFVTSVKKDFKLTLLRLNQRALSLSSPVLLRQYLTSIFIGVDIRIREGQLFCDVLCDKGPLYNGQIKRMAECERLIIAMELAGWLNEANLALQAVIQCYGLLAPLIYYKIPSYAVLQILLRCHAVMQEIPSGLIQKRQGQIADSLHHMTACITFHMAKILRTWGQRKLANDINDAGRKLLSLEERDDKKIDPETDKIESTTGVETESANTALQALKKKKVKKGGQAAKMDEPEGPINEELKALEAHVLQMTKAAHGEHELSGSEDPNILHAYIAFLPSKLAYKEVVKFKRRARYLEFFVHVCEKALTEGFADIVVDWCEDSLHWLSKRNEQIIGPRAFMSKQPGVVTVSGDDPKKFAAAMIEYHKDKQGLKTVQKPLPIKTSPKRQGAKKKQKYKPLGITTGMSESAKRAQEEKELSAIEKLSLYLPDLYHARIRRKRLRKICSDEMPWRCQLNIIQGLSHFGTFLQKLEKREKLQGSSSSNMYKTSFLDQEWFTFETAGTLVVGWNGGPQKQVSAKCLQRPKLATDSSEYYDLAVESERLPRTGIEIAAAVATGAPCPPSYPVTADIRDDISLLMSEETESRHPGDRDSTTLPSKITSDALCKTFTYFMRAVVLAHRGHHWTLLQNAARALWNCAHSALMRAYTAKQDDQESGLLTIEVLRYLLHQPLHTAADCMLDMMFQIQGDLESQAAKAKSKGKDLGNYFESWMGDITSEKGGASLKFESPIDDLSIVDLRWVRRLCLRVLEIMYYEQKWEKLVDIALRFNALTNDRYAEQVIPLLVQAQRKLTKRLEGIRGHPAPQPHFAELEKQLGRVVTAKDYLVAQLKLTAKPASSFIELGAQIDPEGHNAHCATESQRLVSVPLNILQSLETLRTVLDKSNYTSRALKHSRMLLVLYLAGQQNASDGMLCKSPSKVDFKPMTAQPQRTIPPDLKNETFMSASDVQTTPLPQSQFGTVLGAYDRTIDLLLSKGQKGLASQALRELGNLSYHAGNLRGAYKNWTDSLDIVLNMTDSLRCWRSQLKHSGDISSELLKRCGLWGCIHGAVLASNIAQYILTSDLGHRTECCFLSGYLFKALFRSSLPHPTADRDYALYEVGLGCEVTSLIPGVDLLSDRFRADGRQLVSALRWVTEELARGRHNLFVLPLLTQYQYLTTFMCRDLQRSVDGRILKIRVLTDLHLFSEALITLQQLLHGEHLPHTGDSHFRQVESKMLPIKFDTSKPVLDSNNLKVIEMVLDKRLSSSLSTLYGPHLTCHLSIAQAHLFVTLAQTIPVLPTMEDFTAVPETHMSHKAHPILTHRQSIRAQGFKSPGELGSGYASFGATKRFSDSKEKITLEVIKGTLLGIADKIMSSISEVIMENAEHDKGLRFMSAAELEIVVLCKLEQAAIARQKHHAPLAARIVFSALKMLQKSDLFKPKKPAPPPPREATTNSERPSSMKNTADQDSQRQQHVDIKLVEAENFQFQYQNFQSRSRLDARLWLDCRLMLVKSLLMHIQGMGDVKGPNNKVLNELADCRLYCAEGLSEAETCGDKEMQAEFCAQGAYLNIVEGKSLEHTMQLIEDAIDYLHKIHTRSNAGDYLLAVCIMFRMDLECVNSPEHQTDILLSKSLDRYILAQKVILKQMENLGQKIQHYNPKGEKDHMTTPVNPIDNIYLPFLLQLTQVKLRIGHAKARIAARKIRNGTDNTNQVALWSDALGVLTTAVELSQVSVTREANLEAEILFMMGKVQKMLVLKGAFAPKMAASTLLDAIKIAFCTDHDLGLIRQAYLEIAMIYFYSTGVLKVRDGVFFEPVDNEGNVSTRYKLSLSKKGKTKTSSPKVKRKEEELLEQDTERRAAWIAVRSAAVTAQAQRSRVQLIGDVKVTTQKLSDRALKEIPEFCALDLVSSYVLGEKKRVFKNEIEEELAPLIAAQEVKQVETYEDQIVKAKEEALGLGWIHILGYQTILQRLCSTATISVSSHQDTTSFDGGNLGSEFDLGFISHAQFDMTLNHNIVRSMLFSGTWSMRLNQLHSFLFKHLPDYAINCCAMPPPVGIKLLVQNQKQQFDIPLTATCYHSCKPQDEAPAAESEGEDEFTPPGYRAELLTADRKISLVPGDSECILQWYQPSLEEGDPSRTDIESVDRRIILFYAQSKGLGDDQEIFSTFLWISHPQLNDLHDRLAVLAQRAEISLLKKDKPKEIPPTATKSKKNQKIKALSPKAQKDEKLEALLRQCLDDCAILLGTPASDQESTTTEIPFEVSRVNIRSLEELFDASFGLILKGSDISVWLNRLLGTTIKSSSGSRSQ